LKLKNVLGSIMPYDTGSLSTMLELPIFLLCTLCCWQRDTSVIT
jgi:hypothetical protein